MSTDSARFRTYNGRPVTPGGTDEMTWEATRLLTRAERVEVRAAHEFEFHHVAGVWRAECACGTAFESEHAHVVSEESAAHVADVLEFTAGRKCAQARANAAAAIEAALEAGQLEVSPARRSWWRR